MNDTSLDWYSQVRNYYDIGLNILPAKEDTKIPALSAWKWWMYDRQSLDDFGKFFHPESRVNVAVVCGEGSGNLYCVDCERADIFRDFAAQVKSAIGPTITVQTARGGHIWLRASYPVAPDQFDGWEIKAQGGYVLAPPSLHPTGAYYQEVSTEFTIATANHLPFVELKRATSRKISKLAQQIYRGVGPEYKSRSERDHAFVLSLAKSGFSFKDISDFILSAQYNSKYRELWAKNKETADEYLQRSFDAVGKLPEDPVRLERQIRIGHWKQWAMAEQWKGRTGLTDRAVFLAHLEISERACLLEYNASVRELAELAQISAPTAGTSTRRLIDLGVIKRADVGEPRDYTEGVAASGFSLAEEPPGIFTKHIDMSEGHKTNVYICTRKIPESHAVWERAGLGKAAESVWHALSADSLPDYKAIAIATGRALVSIKRLIPKMIRQGLILKTIHGYAVNPDINLDAVAQRLGAVTKNAERKQKHAKEREVQREQYEFFKWRTKESKK